MTEKSKPRTRKRNVTGTGSVTRRGEGTGGSQIGNGGLLGKLLGSVKESGRNKSGKTDGSGQDSGRNGGSSW